MTTRPQEVPYHGLFLPDDGLNPEFEPEPFAKIFVARFEQSGKVRVPQWFPPEALREPSDLFVRFGGGTYEVEARRANGSIYAKRLYSFPGDPKALVDPTATPASAPQLAPAPAPLPPGLDPMIAMMMQNADAAAARSQAMILGLVTALAPVLAAVVGGQKPNGSSPAEMMQAFAALTQASKPPPAPPPTPLAEVLAVQRAIDDAAALRTSAATQQARSLQPEESTIDMIRAVAEVAGPLLMSGGAAGIPVPKLPS
jgi:hypothetical protein